LLLQSDLASLKSAGSHVFRGNLSAEFNSAFHADRDDGFSVPPAMTLSVMSIPSLHAVLIAASTGNGCRAFSKAPFLARYHTVVEPGWSVKEFTGIAARKWADVSHHRAATSFP